MLSSKHVYMDYFQLYIEAINHQVSFSNTPKLPQNADIFHFLFEMVFESCSYVEFDELETTSSILYHASGYKQTFVTVTG